MLLHRHVLRLKLVRHPEFTTFLTRSAGTTTPSVPSGSCLGTRSKGRTLKVEDTFGRTTQIFNIAEGTSYNRSHAAMEQWMQNLDAPQASGSQQRRECNDDNNDRRFGGHGGDHRYGGHTYRSNQGLYNNRCDNNGSFPGQQHNGDQGDAAGPWQQGHSSSEGSNQQGGFRPSDDGHFGPRGGGGNDGGCSSHEDEGHAANYELSLEAMRRMRDAWNSRLERLAAEGNGEGLLSFDELLQVVKYMPYELPARATADIDYDEEDAGGQPVFWWSRDRFATGAGGDDFGPEHVPRTVRELLSWRHGAGAVADFFRDVADESKSEDEGGVGLIASGGADGEERPRSPPRKDVVCAANKDSDGGARDSV